MEKKLEIFESHWLAIWAFILILGATAFPYGVEIWIVGIVVAFILYSERGQISRACFSLTLKIKKEESAPPDNE